MYDKNFSRLLTPRIAYAAYFTVLSIQRKKHQSKKYYLFKVNTRWLELLNKIRTKVKSTIYSK